MPWIYQYLRADREEIDVGPFADIEVCRAKKAEHERFGALCSGPTEVADDYKPYTGEPGE